MKKKVFNYVVLALCVIITVASAVNVFGDNRDVIAKAERAVCWDVDKCNYTMTSMVRTPFGQSFTFEANGKSVDVTCRRSAIVFGEYSCEAGK